MESKLRRQGLRPLVGGDGREGRRARIGIVAAALTSAVLVASAADVAAQAVTDVLTIGTVSVSSGTGQVTVPIFIQDNTGTPIGRDQSAGMRISGFAMQVVYGPNPCIDTPASASLRIDLTGGILASQSADIDSRPKVANASQSWIYSSAETNGLIPFTAAPAPGDRIGAMVFNLTGCPAGSINLVITTTGGAEATLNSDSSVSETVGNGGLSVTNGAINIVPITPGSDFYTVAPCRIIDTRNPAGPLGAPPLSGGTSRTFVIVNTCSVPATATAVSVNIAETQAQGSGHLRIYAAGAALPNASTINFSAGQTRANNAILPLGAGGGISVYAGIGAGLTVDFILDVNGYFQ